jgi:hypothetical protein
MSHFWSWLREAIISGIFVTLAAAVTTAVLLH